MRNSDFFFRVGAVWSIRIFAFCILWEWLGTGWKRGFASLALQAVFEVIGAHVYRQTGGPSPWLAHPVRTVWAKVRRSNREYRERERVQGL